MGWVRRVSLEGGKSVSAGLFVDARVKTARNLFLLVWDCLCSVVVPFETALHAIAERQDVRLAPLCGTGTPHLQDAHGAQKGLSKSFS